MASSQWLRPVNLQPLVEVERWSATYQGATGLALEPSDVRVGVEELIDGLVVVRHDLEEPAAPVGVGVDELRGRLKRLVHRDHPTRDRCIDVAHRLGRLELAARRGRLDRGPDLGQVDIDDVTERLLGVIGDADPHRALLVAGVADPLVLGGVLQVLGEHVFTLRVVVGSSGSRLVGEGRYCDWSPVCAGGATGSAYCRSGGSWTDSTDTSSRGVTVSSPPTCSTASAKPPWNWTAVARVSRSPIASRTYGGRSSTPSTTSPSEESSMPLCATILTCLSTSIASAPASRSSCSPSSSWSVPIP